MRSTFPAQTPSAELTLSPRLARPSILLIVVGAASLAAFGLQGIRPWLVAQFNRNGPLAAAEFWAGDAIALFWFLWAATGVVVYGSGRVSDDAARRRRKIVVISITFGLLVRLGFTIALWRHETSAYASGATTTASVVHVRSGDAPYILDCRFVDTAGNAVASEIRVFEYSDEPIPPSLGVRERSQLLYKSLPFAIQIRYDRARPQQCWLDGAGIAHSNDLLPFSLLVILFEAVLLPLIWECSTPGSRFFRITTDFELYRLAPLAIESLILCFFGFLVGLRTL